MGTGSREIGSEMGLVERDDPVVIVNGMVGQA